MSRSKRVEILLTILIVASAALLFRSEWIPPYPERQLELAAEKYDLDLGEPNRWFSAWSIGDGQAFAVIAADPSGMKLSTEIKEPAYRFTRAGYGWLVAVSSLGQEPWIPYGMFTVGLLSLAGVVAMTVYLRERLGAKAFLLILNPALYIGFAGDTSEPLAILMLTIALAFGWVWVAVALGVTRPSFMVALIGRWRQLGAGAIAAVLLALYSLFRFGFDQFIPNESSLALPFIGYIQHPRPAILLLGGLALVTLVVGWRRKNWAWVITGLLILSFDPFVTERTVNAWRAAGMLPVLWAFGPRYEATDVRSEVRARSPAVA